jgi:2-polyprenyl-3-methyl-5-hydroxy-6-metoxy-1,4-benzoquinol methylase
MLLKEVFNTIEIAWSIIGKKIRICELGDQRMKWHKDGIAKTFFLNNEALEHVSIDWNGKNGALKLDLRNQLIQDRPQWNCYFDMITNFGTTEHIDGQFSAFKNIHELIKVDGLMIHTVPIVGGWKHHCNYQYTTDYFLNLAKASNYEVVYNDILPINNFRIKDNLNRTLICSILKKKQIDFIEEDAFKCIKTINGYN